MNPTQESEVYSWQPGHRLETQRASVQGPPITASSRRRGDKVRHQCSNCSAALRAEAAPGKLSWWTEVSSFCISRGYKHPASRGGWEPARRAGTMHHWLGVLSTEVLLTQSLSKGHQNRQVPPALTLACVLSVWFPTSPLFSLKHRSVNHSPVHTLSGVLLFL